MINPIPKLDSAIDCIVLAGGLGTRLRPVVSDLPKPLAPINGVPFLSLLLATLSSSPLVRKAVIAVSYKAQAIIDLFSARPFIEFSMEEEPRGTGGAVIKALEKTSSEHVLVINGDSYLDFSMEKLLKEHLTQGNEATLVYTHVDDCSRFGHLEVDEKKKKIKAFHEKTGRVEPGFMNAGIYIFRRTAFKRFSLPERFSLEKDLFPQMAALGQLGAFFSRAAFIDIGTPDSYSQAQALLASLVMQEVYL